jgi:hypothetical protein
MRCTLECFRCLEKKSLDFSHPFEKENEFPVIREQPPFPPGKGAAAFQVKIMEEPHGSRFQ